MGFNIYSIGDDTLNVARSVAAGIHFVWAFILLILWEANKKDDGERNDLVYPLYTSFASWTDSSVAPTVTIEGSECDVPKALAFTSRMSVSPGFKDSGTTISLHWAVVCFFLISAFFQTMAATVTNNRFFFAPTIRFVEYSITAPIMVVAIALQIGIMDYDTLVLLAALTWAAMMAGLCVDKVRMAKKTLTDHDKIARKNQQLSSTLFADGPTINEVRCCFKSAPAFSA
jgi:hypothetical protein